jgi:hypothetical protein
MLIIFFSFYAGSRLILGRGMNMQNILSVIGVSFFVSFVITIMGFLNAKFIFVSSSIGLLSAVAALFIILSRKSTGWEDLIGPLVFLEITILSFAVGVVLEIGAWILKKIRRKADELK